MKKMRKNNKGFSLVELIVVIAIMAILAVTLAPRLTQYVERSRKASDQEAINTIFTAAKLAYLEEPIGTTIDDTDVDTPLDLGASTDNEALYQVSADGKKWTLQTEYPGAPAEFYATMIEILGDFKLKSNQVKAETMVTLSVSKEGKLAVTLDYDGDGGYTAETDYQVTE